MKDLIKVLLVDDDEEDFMLTEEIFEEIPYHKYKIDWIDNFKMAKDRILEEKHDIYLIDYRLGVNSGLELIRECLEEAKVYKPFILLTGQGDRQTDQEAMQAGASDYLVKGKINAFELERSIRYSIKQAENIQQIRLLNETLEKRVIQRTYELQETNRHLQEEIKEKKAIAEALTQSQKLYKAIARNYPQGSINVLNRNLDYIFVEGAELRKLGFTPEQLIGTSFLENFEVEEKQILQENIEKAFEGEYINFELKLDKNYYIYSAVPLQEKQSITQVLLVSQNTTTLKEAALRTLDALEKEKVLNEMKSRFVSLASHEFRTPLGTILSSASLIGRYETTEQQNNRLKHVNRIKSSVVNLTGILNDFLSLSKLEEGKIEIHKTQFNLQDLINEVLEEMSSITKTGQNIIYHHHGATYDFIQDSKIFKNILINLISNAIKYSSTDKIIKVDTKIEDKQMCLTVEDKGMGIPKEEQKNLFERFFRASNAGNIQGTGLGLNIVKRYVDLLKGKISFESEENQGTTFRVILQNMK